MLLPRLASQLGFPNFPGSAPEHSVQQVASLLDTIGEGLKADRKPSTQDEASQLVDALLKLTESLVWGEKHDGSLFDLFCERHGLSQFIKALLVASTPTVVRVQLLQSLSILVQNARRDTTSFYLFSGGRLNALISGDLNIGNADVLAYFVSFLKSLALRLDDQTALLFLDQGSFPLFARALQFTTHEDLMVRTSSRTTLLSLLQIKQEQVRACTIDATQHILVPTIATALRITWAIAEIALNLQDADILKATCEVEADVYELLNDLIALDIGELSTRLLHGVFASTVLPLLAGLSPPMAYPDQASPEAESVQFHPAAFAFKKVIHAADYELAGSGVVQRCLVSYVLKRLLLRKFPDQAAMLALDTKRMQLQLSSSTEPLLASPKGAGVLRALCNFFATFSSHSGFVEPLAKALLAPSLESAFVGAVYAPDSNSAPLTTLMSPESVGDFVSASVPIPNPFRESLVLMIASGDNGVTASEAPLAAWTLRELHMACPDMWPSMPHPKLLVESLRARAGLPRIAQRILSTALLELVSSCNDETRHDISVVAFEALTEAAITLRAAAESEEVVCSEEIVASFLAEWEWHQKSSSNLNIPVVCRGFECLLQCAQPKQQRAQHVLSEDTQHAPRMEEIRCAARAILTLRQFSSQLAAGSEGAKKLGTVEEACPLDIGSGNVHGSAGVLQCSGPNGFGYSLMLHPSQLIVSEPSIGASYFSDRTPLWRVVATADASDPLMLRLRIVAPTDDGRWREVALTFSNAQTRARASLHFQDCKERLLSQLIAFIACVLQDVKEV